MTMTSASVHHYLQCQRRRWDWNKPLNFVDVETSVKQHIGDVLPPGLKEKSIYHLPPAIAEMKCKGTQRALLCAGEQELQPLVTSSPAHCNSTVTHTADFFWGQ